MNTRTGSAQSKGTFHDNASPLFDANLSVHLSGRRHHCASSLTRLVCRRFIRAMANKVSCVINRQRESHMLKRLALWIATIGAVTLPLLGGTPAQAQNARSWVSGVGDDGNPCTRTLPCLT